MTLRGRRSMESGIPIFEGSRRQRGGNLFRTIQRAIIPLGKSMASKAGEVLKSTGKDLAKRSIKVGVNALKDKLSGSVPLSSALKQQASKEMEKAVQDYFPDVENEEDEPDIPFNSQDGAGLLTRKRRRRRTQSRTPAKRPRRRRQPVRKKATTRGRRRKPVKRLGRKTINKMKRVRRKTRSNRDIFDIFT